MRRIYLDNNATTALSPKVLEAMLEELSGPASNPSSVHFFGQKARQKILRAREIIADFFHFPPQDVLFTSGGTEAMNTLIHAAASHLPKGQILTSTIEHPCVDRMLTQLARNGWEIIALSPGEKGMVDETQIKNALTEKTRFIVLAAVNNETGVKCPIDAIAGLAKERGIPLLVDGVAWLGKEKFTLHPGISGIGFSAHKIHGPKGAGFALLRSSLRFAPLFVGGPQEYGRRAGTENLAGILGTAAAVTEISTLLPEAEATMRKLRDDLERGLVKSCAGIVNGLGERISNTLNISLLELDGETLLIQLDQMGIAASHGSACSAGAMEPSRILLNMGLSYERIRSSLRFSLSRYTTGSEIAHCLAVMRQIHTTLFPVSK